MTDGDTIELHNGERIRYIGIDAPEKRRSGGEGEEYSEEAFLANKALVEGKVVRLEYDAERLDIYKRTLSYVYLQTDSTELFVNSRLVANGLARASPYPPNTKHAALLKIFQSEASEKKIGIWSTQNSHPETIIYRGLVVASSRSTVYHKLNCFYAGKIKQNNKILFDSASKAREARYRHGKICFR